VLAKGTLTKYAAVARYCQDYFEGTAASAIAVEDASEFTDWLRTYAKALYIAPLRKSCSLELLNVTLRYNIHPKTKQTRISRIHLCFVILEKSDWVATLQLKRNEDFNPPS
jgi:hypothetical protein